MFENGWWLLSANAKLRPTTEIIWCECYRRRFEIWKIFKEVDENAWEEGSHITKEEHNEIKKSEEI